MNARLWAMRLGLTFSIALGTWLSDNRIRAQEFTKSPPAAGPIQPAGQVEVRSAVDSLLPAQPIPTTNPQSASASLAPTSAQSTPLTAADAPAVRQIVADYLAELEAKRKQQDDLKKKEADEKGHEVGSNLNMNAKWVEGSGLFFMTPNEDWKIHVGGRFQFEPVFFQQPATLKGPAPGNGGIPASAPNGGLGSLDDGAYFRRVRLRTDGVGYETIEFALEVDFEQLNYITYDHIWVGMKDLPFLGTVRIGQHKVPLGMENMGSDYHLTFLERSSTADAFSVLFGPGIWMSNNFLNDNICFQTMVHKTQPLAFYTSAFGDGNYASSTRLTGTPIYRNDGNEVIHIGASYQRRTGNLGRELQPGGTGSTFGDSQNVLRFRARPDLRDGVGLGGQSNAVGAPLAVGDLGRMVDTGFMLANNVQTVVPEFLAIYGPFSVQAESYLVKVDNAKALYGPNRVGTPLGNPFFWGGYVEGSYFLTGEHRGYDRRNGMYDRPVLKDYAFMVRGEDGCVHWNWGAWQVAYRYSYIDLDSAGVNGGTMNQHTFGMNWYLNNTTKVQFQYNISQRNVVGPADSGTIHGYGFLAQWYF